MSKRIPTKAERKSLMARRWGIKGRCYSESSTYYRHYGGRGIRVCDEWLDKRIGLSSFVSWAMENGFRVDLEIDRIDNDGDYEPGNCHWVTREVNARNKRNNRRMTAFGETKLLVEWAEDPRCVVGSGTMESRIRDCGYSLEEAMTSPLKLQLERSHNVDRRIHEFFGKMMSLEQIINDPRCIVSNTTMRKRIKKWDCTAQECATTPLREIDSKRKFHLAWGESKTLYEWVNDKRCKGASLQAIRLRIRRGTMSNEEAISKPPRRMVNK